MNVFDWKICQDFVISPSVVIDGPVNSQNGPDSLGLDPDL
jgi:hypothetical protein